jgi:serine/threonine-protein kinase RsbW
VDTVELVVPGKPEYVRSVRLLAADIAESIPLPPSSVEELKVAVGEAITNVVRHAYHGCHDEIPVFIAFHRSENELVIEITDQGCGFDPPGDECVSRLPDLSKVGGLGIILIKQLMDGVMYWSRPGQGTHLRMSKCVERDGWKSKKNGRQAESDDSIMMAL